MEIRCLQIGFTYNLGTPVQVSALRDVTLSVSGGRAIGIVGGNGSGKTTLLKLLNGLLLPTKGRVLVEGTDTREWGSELRRCVGVVLRAPEHRLFGETVKEDIAFALRKMKRFPPQEIAQRVQKACDLTGLSLDDTADVSPSDLTVAEKRKVALAGILCNEPGVLALDEPDIGLDPPSRAELCDLLEHLKQDEKMGLVISSHDMDLFLPLLDELIMLREGLCAFSGSPAAIIDSREEDSSLSELVPPLPAYIRDMSEKGISLEPDGFNIEHLAAQIIRHYGGSA